MQLAAKTVGSVGVTAGARGDAAVRALSWLASQLAWERTLDALRDGDHAVAGAKAA